MPTITLSSSFIRYCLVGGIGLLIDLSIFFFLHNVVRTPYQQANLVSSHAGLINNFILNSMFTFNVRDKKGSRFVKYYLIALVSIGFSALLLHLFIDELSIHALVAKLITILLIAIFQFSLNKRLTFKR